MAATKPEHIEAQLTEFDAFAILKRDQSWNAQPNNARLLDHEQGHFDLAELNARRMRQNIAKLLTGAGLVGKGRDRAAADANLEELLRARLKVFNDRDVQDQEQYDQITRHGTKPIEQAEQRKAQREALEKKE